MQSMLDLNIWLVFALFYVLYKKLLAMTVLRALQYTQFHIKPKLFYVQSGVSVIRYIYVIIDMLEYSYRFKPLNGGKCKNK